jgi:transposase-like protein
MSLEGHDAVIELSRRHGIGLIHLHTSTRRYMTQKSGAAFDPNTVTLLKEVLVQAEGALPVQKRSPEVRVKLATCILKAAAEGERDPARLRKAALVAVQ